MTAAVHPIQGPQITRNSERVVEWFASASGLESFGCNDASIGYIDGFLSRQGHTLTESPQVTERVISLIGSFLGQCMVQRYNGRWVSTGTGPQVEVKAGQWTHTTQPFDQVAKRLRYGETESLLPYYRNMLSVGFRSAPQSASADPSTAEATPAAAN